MPMPVAIHSWAVITAQTLSDSSTSNCTDGYRLNASGIAEEKKTLTYTLLEQWLKTGNPADFECKVHVNSGTLTSGTVDTWLALTSSREWYVTRTTIGTSAVNMTVDIRRKSASSSLFSVTVTLSAEKTV